MATSISTTEQSPIIRIDIDGKKYRLELSHSSSAAELRTILSKRYHISSNTHFLDAEGCTVFSDDEGSVTVSQLLIEKNVVKTVTDKSKPESISIPQREFKPTGKKMDVRYAEVLNQKTAIRELITPGSTPTRPQHEVILATQLDSETWRQIFVNCNLFYGVRMNDKIPESAEYSLLKFRESDNIIPLYKVKDESYTRTYMKDKEMQTSFVSSQFFDGGLEISYSFIGIGVNGEYLKSKAETNTERPIYITCCFNYSRVTVILDSSYLELTSEFIEAIDDVLLILTPDEQIIKLKEVYSRYGHVYPSRVVLGGQLYRTETHKVQDKVEEEKKRQSAETSFNTSLAKPLKMHLAGGSENNSQKKSSEQTSEIVCRAVGGNTLTSRDPTIWTETVNYPLLWRVIEQDKFQPVATLLDKERQQKIQEIENYNVKKKMFGHMYTKWKQEGITLAGGNGQGDELNQLCHPTSISIDDDQTIYIADSTNDRIVEWKYNATNGQIVAGGNGEGNQTNQLHYPRDVIIDKENNSLIISDQGNRRVMRWSRRNNTKNGEIIIEDIDCSRLAMDKDGSIYVSDYKKNEVRRWKRGDKKGTIVAGGNGEGNQFNQLNCPTYIFIDEDYSLYVSDCDNHRVMKWVKDAKEGMVVAGGNDKGNSLTQLSNPQGVFVDQLGQIYVADFSNDRVMRWCKGAKEGTIVVGGNGEGEQSNQLNGLRGLSFDRQGNLYVADEGNNRIQKFEIY